MPGPPVADMLSRLAHSSSQGILNNWDVEKTVWDRVFGYKGRGMKVS